MSVQERKGLKFHSHGVSESKTFCEVQKNLRSYSFQNAHFTQTLNNKSRASNFYIHDNNTYHNALFIIISS